MKTDLLNNPIPAIVLVALILAAIMVVAWCVYDEIKHKEPRAQREADARQRQLVNDITVKFERVK